MTSPNSVMRRIFYLGPHPDDIVFSCAGSVLADVQSGADVTMVSVFVSGEQADLRRAEDERAARALGCKYLSLDLFEACLLYTSPSPRDRTRSRMPSSA